MYSDSEIQVSRDHLERVLTSLEGPLVLLGGWAVFIQVNGPFKEATGREYLGSRDIDLGFSMNTRVMESTPMAQAIRVLVDELGFQPLSFRLMNEFDNETGEPLEPEVAKRLPIYRIFQLYVDLMVDRVPEGFREAFGFIPPDEPLLAGVFEDARQRVEVQVFGKVLWMPAPPVLVKMKVRSFPNRTRDHKRIKDLADIAALVLFAGPLRPELEADEEKAFRDSIEEEEMGHVASVLGLGQDTVETAVLSILRH